MRTSGPWRPSGRRFGSTGKMAPSGVVRSQTRIRPAASRVAAPSAASSEVCSSAGSAGSALGDEDHVDVAGVVQLAGAALAHRHDRQPGARGGGGFGRVLGPKLGPGYRQGRVEDGVGEVGQLGRRLVDRDDAGLVAGGQVQDAAAVGGGEQAGRVGRGVADRSRRHPVVRVGADRAQQLGPDLSRPGTVVGVPAAQDGAVGRVAGEVIGQGPADPEDGDQPGAERRVLGQAADQALVSLGDLRQACQGEVGVGRLGERGEQRVVVACEAEAGELTLRPRHVGEAHPGQPAGQGRTRAAHGNERIPRAWPAGKYVCNVRIPAGDGDRTGLRGTARQCPGLPGVTGRSV